MGTYIHLAGLGIMILERLEPSHHTLESNHAAIAGHGSKQTRIRRGHGRYRLEPNSAQDANPDAKGQGAGDARWRGQELSDVRSGYARELEHGKDAKHISMDDMRQALTRANDAFSRVKGPSEAILDSHLLLNFASLTTQKAKSLKHDAGGFDDQDFVAQLVTFLGGRRADVQPEQDDDEDLDGPQWLAWSKLTPKIMARSKAAPAIDFMLGPLSVEQKKRQATQRAKLDKNKKEEVKPEEVCPPRKYQAGKRLVGVRVTTDSQAPEPFLYRVVLDACDPPDQNDYAEGGIQKRQLVMELDVATWKRAIEVFNITESVIPTRDYSKNMQPPGKKGWY
ncbi:Nse4 domain-containing protein [Rhizoctonia solani AG-1 IA]|uniref:Non-structural maintenance of chromosomes element 4 n=1 Tax=Thanatephorus cucumeris (strain AG1-IA) TaxID=983506 RepID=L8WNS3_THACA|nr:Nse4 domain-containing protein [Rhizoctonia solani AG-1 IA]